MCKDGCDDELVDILIIFAFNVQAEAHSDYHAKHLQRVKDGVRRWEWNNVAYLRSCFSF